MNRMVSRLIRCGMSRSVALTVCRSFHGRLKELEDYVEAAEEECREPMEEV